MFERKTCFCNGHIYHFHASESLSLICFVQAVWGGNARPTTSMQIEGLSKTSLVIATACTATGTPSNAIVQILGKHNFIEDSASEICKPTRHSVYQVILIYSMHFSFTMLESYITADICIGVEQSKTKCADILVNLYLSCYR